VGKNIPTSRTEDVEVRLEEIDGDDAVVLLRHSAQSAGDSCEAQQNREQL